LSRPPQRLLGELEILFTDQGGLVAAVFCGDLRAITGITRSSLLDLALAELAAQHFIIYSTRIRGLYVVALSMRWRS